MATATATKAKPKAEGLDSGAKVKLGLAIGIFVLAGAYLAYTTLGGGSEPAPANQAPMTAEEQQKQDLQIQEARKAAEEAKARPGTIEAGE